VNVIFELPPASPTVVPDQVPADPAAVISIKETLLMLNEPLTVMVIAVPITVLFTRLGEVLALPDTVNTPETVWLADISIRVLFDVGFSVRFVNELDWFIVIGPPEPNTSATVPYVSPPPENEVFGLAIVIVEDAPENVIPVEVPIFQLPVELPLHVIFALPSVSERVFELFELN